MRQSYGDIERRVDFPLFGQRINIIIPNYEDFQQRLSYKQSRALTVKRFLWGIFVVLI
jgi:hypothetical protein